MVDIKKNEKYEKQQKEILEKLLNLLNFNGDYTFYMYNLENNQELQENIMNLGKDIKKYYSCKGLNNKICKKPYLSIIKYILKVHNKEIYNIDCTLTIDNKKIRTKKLKII